MPKKRETIPKPAKPEKQAKKREGPVSLCPLTFEEAVRGLLAVKPDSDDAKMD